MVPMSLQNTFDLIGEKYLVPLSNELEEGLQRALQHTNMDVFLAELYECMLLQTTVRQDANDEDHMDYTDMS